MNPIIGIALATTLQVASPPPQVLHALERFLEARPVTNPRSSRVEFKVEYASFQKEKPSGTFRDSGRMLIETTEKGAILVGSLPGINQFQIGESPLSVGKQWFNGEYGPSRMAPFANAGEFLVSTLRQLPLKAVETPSQGDGKPGDQILVFRLEAPRPDAKLWRFKSTDGEARLHIQNDGTPVNLRVVQSYDGRLNPHFGRYTLDRKEEWTFETSVEGVQVRQYRLRLHRQDWNESRRAVVEMVRGERP